MAHFLLLFLFSSVVTFQAIGGAPVATVDDCPYSVLDDKANLRVLRDRCYHFFLHSGQERTFSGARQVCRQRHYTGDLAEIHDRQTDDLLDNTMRNEFHFDRSMVMIGLSNWSDRQWRWVGGRPLQCLSSYSNFVPGSFAASADNGSCVYIDTRPHAYGYWDTYDCDTIQMPFVCEYMATIGQHLWLQAHTDSTTTPAHSDAATSTVQPAQANCTECHGLHCVSEALNGLPPCPHTNTSATPPSDPLIG